MPQRPIHSALVALLLGATLLLPWLAGSAAAAAPHRPPAAASTPAGPFERLWQSLVDLIHGGLLGGRQVAPGRPLLPDAGCSLNPDGLCTTNSPRDSGCSANPDGHCSF
ncbi:MAG TPA: hypothetical protein VJA16_04380 [Thermoanaerobaculia bacterium]